MATEIAVFSLNAGKHPDKLEGEDAKSWQEVTKILSEQSGFQKARAGVSVEDPEKLYLFFDWASVDDHKKFMAADYYKSFLGKASAVINLSTASISHVKLDPHPASVALEDAPVTEVITLYFPTDYSQADQDKTEADLRKLLEVLKGDNGCIDASGGWVIESVPIPDGEGEAKAFVGLVGWQSIDAHLKARETESFGQNIHLLRGAKDLKKVTMIHVDVKDVQA